MKIIEWLKSRWNKKQNDSKQEQLSDAELLQKKKDFQVRKQAIDTCIHTLSALNFCDNLQELNNVAWHVLDTIDTAMRKLKCFDKYDLTNPCMTYEEHRNVVIAHCRQNLKDISKEARDIPIEVLVYYALNEPYLQRLLNNCDNIEYQRYCGMFKDGVVIFLVDLGFKSMFD